MRISSRKRGQVSESRHTETLNSIELWVRTDHAVCHWRTGAATATSGRSPQDLPAGWRTRLIQGKCDRQAPYAALRSQPKPPRHTSTPQFCSFGGGSPLAILGDLREETFEKRDRSEK